MSNAIRYISSSSSSYMKITNVHPSLIFHKKNSEMRRIQALPHCPRDDEDAFLLLRRETDLSQRPSGYYMLVTFFFK